MKKEITFIYLFSGSLGKQYGNNVPRRKYKAYEKTRMNKAFKAVMCGKMNAQEAAKKFGVPRTTLYDKVFRERAKHPNRKYIYVDQ